MYSRIMGGLVVAVVMVGCASVPNANPSIAQVDLSAERLVSDLSSRVSTHMIAEIVLVEDLSSGDILYRYDVEERADIDQQILDLMPGEYRLAAICNDRLFTKRFTGFIELQLKQERYWWGKFATNSGSTGIVKVDVFDVDVRGGELIAPVNMSAAGGKACDVSYGQAKLNAQPSAKSENDAFRDKFAEKARLYN